MSARILARVSPAGVRVGRVTAGSGVASGGVDAWGKTLTSCAALKAGDDAAGGVADARCDADARGGVDVSGGGAVVVGGGDESGGAGGEWRRGYGSGDDAADGGAWAR